MEACNCTMPEVSSLTGRIAEQYPDQYCRRCGRWLEGTLRAVEERKKAKEAAKHAR